MASNTLNNIRILIVDDSKLNIIILKKQLSIISPEAIIKTAESGAEAIKITNNEMFNIIFIDVRMPILDGFETSIKIRNESLLNKVTPIIAVTAHITADMYQKCTTFSINNIISRPMTLEILTEQLNKYNTELRS
ncbi:protein-glutamate methylesterase [Flavobacteriaceae bacterium UJ101]|nr:protein-glutamate methylesterase [Flavobacteriaceae bacterium UJ101]